MLSTFQANAKYVHRSVAVAETQELHDQLFKLLGTLDDPKQIIEYNRALLCCGEVAQLNYQLRTTFASFDTLCYPQWSEVYVLVHKAKRLLNQYDNA